MFGPFLYFIVALLIYSTYPKPEAPPMPAVQTVGFLVGLSLVYAVYVHLQFRRLANRLDRIGPAAGDRRYTSLSTRLSILAVAVYAVDIYALGLPAYVGRLPGLDVFPTAEALIFVLLFVGYLSLVWAAGHRVHRKLYRTGISLRAQLASNVSFAVPVLLPWFLLSGIADLIGLLPWRALRQALQSPAGEFGYFLCFLALAAITGPVLIRRFWGCRPLPDGPARRRIAAVCQRAQLRYAEILQWPIYGGRMITAGVMGLVRRFRYILITDALLDHLTPTELDQVIAHEIGHVRRHHLLFYLLFFAGYLVLAYAAFDLVVVAVLYAPPVLALVHTTGFDPTRLASFLLSGLMVAVFLVYFRFLFGFFMRNFERQADLYVYRLFDSARPLIHTLAKIAAASGISPEKPNWHHFSIRQRMDYLERCEADPQWIDRHDRKVRRAIWIYLGGLAAVVVLGWQMNTGAVGQRLTRHYLQTAVEHELARNPDQPALLVLLGDLQYGRQRLAAAASAYERAIRIDPRQPQALNNLAWLYATSPAPELRHPRRALKLALQAAAIEPAAHVLDTLAESYFVNGRHVEAVVTARRALAAGGGDRAYLEGQLEKFRRAAERSEAEVR